MEKLNLNSCKVNEKFEGDVGVKVASLQLTKNGDHYISGTMINVRDTWAFKIWDKGLIKFFRDMIESDVGFKPFVAHVKGRVDEFNGNLSFVVNSVERLYEDYKEFLPTLDINMLRQEYEDFVDDNVATNYVKVINQIFDTDVSLFNGESASIGDTIGDLFFYGWAASGNHDAIQGGLCHHTLKMLYIARTMINTHPALEAKKDIIYTGIILHDIGKVQEIVDGNYTKNSFISHRIMGIEYLAANKSFIVMQIGIDEYSRLLDILIGHHDQFEQKPKTIWGYLVHLIDMLDTWATITEQELTTDLFAKNAMGERTLKTGDRFFIL